MNGQTLEISKKEKAVMTRVEFYIGVLVFITFVAGGLWAMSAWTNRVDNNQSEFRTRLEKVERKNKDIIDIKYNLRRMMEAQGMEWEDFSKYEE